MLPISLIRKNNIKVVESPSDSVGSNVVKNPHTNCMCCINLLEGVYFVNENRELMFSLLIYQSSSYKYTSYTNSGGPVGRFNEIIYEECYKYLNSRKELINSFDLMENLKKRLEFTKPMLFIRGFSTDK